MSVKLLLLLTLLSPVVRGQPVDVRLTLPDPAISEGPGMGGSPILVDTRGHLLRGKSAQPVWSAVAEPVRRPVLPVIRPATNVPGATAKSEARTRPILELLARKLNFLLSLAVDEQNRQVEKERENHQKASSSPIQIKIQTSKRLGSNKDTENDSTPAKSRPVQLRLGVSREKNGRRNPVLSFLNHKKIEGDDDLPLIRPATNVENKVEVNKLAVIRPATNV